jgi:hypothetical protein
VHFVLLLLLLLVAASIHVTLMKDRTTSRVAEIGLLYILVGYCGLPMLAISVWILVSPDGAAASFGFGPAGPVVTFFGYAYLGMSVLSLLALKYRRSFLIAPAILWSIYFAGATFVHLKEYGQRTSHAHGGALEIFAAHGLIAVLLMVGLVLSGRLRDQG